MRKRLALAFVVLGLLALLGRWVPSLRRPARLPTTTLHTSQTQGRVTVEYVYDGDTLRGWVAVGDAAQGSQEKVRLYGIDAPELHPPPGSDEAFTPHPFGQAAREYLERLCPPGTQVRAEFRGRDRFERVLAVLYLPDGRDVNQAMIELGLAKALVLRSTKGDPLLVRYQQSEAKARAAGVGLWGKVP